MLFMKRINTLLTCAAAAASLSGWAQGNLDFRLGNGLSAQSADGLYRMSMGGSVQLLTVGSSAPSPSFAAYPSLGFMRLQGSSKPESAEFFVQMNFAEPTPLLDAWVRFKTKWSSRITLGQMQNVSNGLEMLVYEDVQSLPWRSIASQAFVRSGREAGLLMDHRWVRDRWSLGVFAQVTSGDGRNSFGVDSRDVDLGGLKYSGRLEAGLGEPMPDNRVLQLASFDRKSRVLWGISGSYNRGASDAIGEGHGTFQMFRGAESAYPDYRKWTADVLAMHRGWSLYGQTTVATATGLQGLQRTPSASSLLRPQEISGYLNLGRSFLAQVEYVHPSRWAAVVRRSLVLSEFGSYSASLTTDQVETFVGINRYVVEHNVKFFAGYRSLEFASSPAENSWVAALQMRF